MESNDPALLQIQEHLDAEFDALVESFLAQTRRGKSPCVEEFAAQHPAHRTRLLELLPTLISLESCVHEDCSLDRKLPEKIGDYTVLGILGRGGMGEVYLAKDPKLERLVAVKVLPPHFLLKHSAVERFQREARATANMEHPNIVPVYAVGKEAGGDGYPDVHYFSMHYIAGPSLEAIIRRLSDNRPSNVTTANKARSTWNRLWSAGSSASRLRETLNETATTTVETTSPIIGGSSTFPDTEASDTFNDDFRHSGSRRWARIASIGIDAASAIEHAHGKEILHRDIKPSNLLIDSTGKTWVTDFGLAKFLQSDHSTTDGIVGTLRFMAPERFSGWADHRSDVYSLGMTLYELVTLSPAFSDADRSTLIAKIMDDEVPPPRKRVPSIPVDLETIILKSTYKEPARRYQSAAELRDDLQRFVDNKPIRARRTTWLTTVTRWSKRNPVAAIFAATLMALLAIASLGSAVAAVQFRELADELEKEKDNASRSLLLAYESEAHALTNSHRPGHRVEALKAIRNAVELLPKVEHTHEDILRLRNDAIVAFTLDDIEFKREFPANTLSGARASPDFKYFAWSDNRGRLVVCDAETGEKVWSFQNQMRFPKTHVIPYFSPDSRYVASYSDASDKIRLFELASGRVLLELDYQRLDVFAPVGFSQDGRWFAVPNASDPMHLYDLDNLYQAPTEIDVPFVVNSVVFVDDDRSLCAYRMYGDGKIFVHDMETRENRVEDTKLDGLNCIAAHDDGVYLGHGRDGWGEVRSVAWPALESRRFAIPFHTDLAHVGSGDEAGLFSARDWYSGYQLRDASNGRLLFEDWGRWPVLHDDGKHFAHAIGQKIRFYNLHTNDRYLRSRLLNGKTDYFTPVLSPNGELLLTSTEESLKLWDAASLAPLDTFTSANGVWGERFLGNNKTLAVVDGKLTLFDLDLKQDRVRFGDTTVLADASSHDACVTVSSEGKRVAWRAPDDTVYIASVDAINDAHAINLTTPRDLVFKPFFALSPDGKVLVAADQTIKLFDAADGSLLHDFGSESEGNRRTAFSFSPDSRFVIYNSGHDHMLIDIRQRQIVKRMESSGFRGGAEWSPDGSLLATAIDQETILLRSTDDFEEVARLRTPEKIGVHTIRFDPQGTAVYANVARHQIYRWNLAAIREQLDELGLNWAD